MEGLCESVKGEWSGDIDLHDGQLQQMFQQYHSRLQFIDKIGLDERHHSLLFTNLQQENQSLENDLEFLAASMRVYVFCRMGACVRLFMSVCVCCYTINRAVDS